MLCVVLLEAVWLTWWRGWTPGAAAVCLLPGALLLLALRAALTGFGWQWVALALLLSFPAHLADVALRERSAAK